MGNLISYLAIPVIFFMLMVGCEDSATTPKPSIITQEKMVRLHADLLIANAAVANLYGPLRDSMAQVYQSQIFTMNGVEKADYEASLRIYADDLVAMDSIYAKTRVILDSLERVKMEK